MSEHLEKAKGAMVAAKSVAERIENDDRRPYQSWAVAEADHFHRHLYVALVQATIAQAEALERLVERLDGMLPG